MLRSALALVLALGCVSCGGGGQRLVVDQEIDLHRHFEQWDDGCLVLLETASGRLSRYNRQRCEQRFVPCSTFKIPNALIGLETGVISGADHTIEWDGRERSRAVTNQDHTLATAVRHSVVWYFQEVARRVGMKRMQHYVSAIPYGNQQLGVDVTTFWLEGPLAVSANEQVAFMSRLLADELPFSPEVTASVREIIVVGRSDDSIYRGKTGSGRGAEADLGWYVGSVSRPSGDVVFACNITGRGAWGPRAREICESVLIERGVLDPALRSR